MGYKVYRLNQPTHPSVLFLIIPHDGRLRDQAVVRSLISHYKCFDHNVMFIHAVMGKAHVENENKAVSGPQGTPFHHLSKQAWRPLITKNTPTLLLSKNVLLGLCRITHSCIIVFKQTHCGYSYHTRHSECWGPVTVAGKPHCALNNSPLNLFFQPFLSLIEQSLAKVMGQWLGGLISWFALFIYFVQIYWVEMKDGSLHLWPHRAATCLNSFKVF